MAEPILTPLPDADPALFARLLKNTATAAGDACWEWTGRTTKGYGEVRFKRGGRRRIVRAHRLSWALCVGEIPPGLNVLHRCDNPPCVRPSHLFIGTTQDNITDMWQKSRARILQGSQRSLAKLTEAAVLEIRASPLGYKRLAARYGVDRKLIQAVKKGRAWRHVP